MTAQRYPRPITTDDYERWYTEPTHNNRMLLAIRSGIQTEMDWAFDRLCRLCDNEAWALSSIPGLIDTLFDWPEHFVNKVARNKDDTLNLFRLSNQEEAMQRHALLSMLILRNSTLNAPNAAALSNHKRTRPLIFSALQNLVPTRSVDAEFLLYALELLHIIMSPTAPIFSFLPNDNPIQAMGRISYISSDRALIIASLNALSLVFSEPGNYKYLRTDSPALEASLRFLPVFGLGDKLLTDTCLNYMTVHLSHPPMAKAFLRHPKLPSVLRILVSVVLAEQVTETASLEVAQAAPSVASQQLEAKVLSPAEISRLAEMMEPQRSEEWMSLMFTTSGEGEMTQVEFYTLYRDAFTGVGDDIHPILAAPDLIKALPRVFPNAGANVLPGPPPRFIVRGIERKKEERMLCRWNRGACNAPPFGSSSMLISHVLEHIATQSEGTCEWAACAHPAEPSLEAHVRTHLPAELPPDTSSLGNAQIVTRIPASQNKGFGTTTIYYPRSIADAPSTTLTALLCIRVLFHHAYAIVERAPRVDDDRFGFPGVIEVDEEDEAAVPDVVEREGTRRGQRAFASVAGMLQNIVLKEEVLMGWVAEMINAAEADVTHDPLADIL